MLKKLFDRAFGRKPATSPANAPGTQASAKVDAVAINLQVIARDGHCISRKHISPNALRVLYKLRDAGFTAYLVGGAVRDLLLQGLPKDFDVATNAHPEQVKHLFRNCRLIGRRFRLAHVHYGAEIIEVATFRGIEDDGSGARELVDGRIVRDNVYGTIEEDAVRRDFTVNALYYAIDDYSVRDYVGGFQDVRDRVLRLIGEPTRRLREDPVRMLRTARFAAKLGFSIDPAIVSAISQLKDLLNAAPAARLFDECLKMFMAGYALASFRQLWQLRLFEVLFPETALALRADPADLVLLETALTSTDQR
ncbi:MAG: polynucleotide adenylyltransferase PcnB, partial [Lysobacterales bacterium CG_4_9_14_3_um_filter_62_6]